MILMPRDDLHDLTGDSKCNIFIEIGLLVWQSAESGCGDYYELY